MMTMEITMKLQEKLLGKAATFAPTPLTDVGTKKCLADSPTYLEKSPGAGER
jgi:hypothetical protein